MNNNNNNNNNNTYKSFLKQSNLPSLSYNASN